MFLIRPCHSSLSMCGIRVEIIAMAAHMGEVYTCTLKTEVVLLARGSSGMDDY
jgi:hypothetical protein